VRRRFILPVQLTLIAAGISLVHLSSGCNPVSILDEEYDVAVLAYILVVEVPDTSSQIDIRITLQGTIGESTAYRFDRINVAQTDSVFRIAVWGRETYKTGATYGPRNNDFDTTLVLTSPRKGMHYFDIVAAQGMLYDSTFVH
jgi:hypothetical protein